MNSSQVMDQYECLLVLTEQMLDAAKEEEWDELINIQRQCGELVANMKRVDVGVMLDQAERQHKKQLINKILADESEIRTRVQVWMRQLQISMQSNRQEQRLLHAYGS